MIQEYEMLKPEIETTPAKPPIEAQLQTYFTNVHARLMNGSTDHEKTENDRKAEAALKYAYEVLVRNDQMCDLVQGEEYQLVRDRENSLKGKTKIGKIFCIDGRIARIFESFAINTWEKAAGLIKAEKRESDGKLIPSSSSFCESIAAKIDYDHPEVELLEINTAHYDSTNPEHGCAAIGLIRRALKRDPGEWESASEEERHVIEDDLIRQSELEEILSKEDIEAILNAPTPEDANLLILEKVNTPAITNIYNDVRQIHGLEPLRRVAITALYDTATTGIELRYDGVKLSTSDLTKKHTEAIQSFGSTIGAGFGDYREALTNPGKFLEFSLKLAELETEIIENKNGRFNELNSELNSYIKDHLDDLTDGQKQALRFKLLRKVAFQHLTGIESPNTHHQEAYIAISVQGQFVGKYDLVEQQFGSSSEDIETAIDETLIANLVMDTNALKEDETRIAFICTSTNRSSWERKTEASRRVRANNADLIRGIAKDERLRALMKEGKLIPIPVLIDENRRVLEIPDHSAYF